MDRDVMGCHRVSASPGLLIRQYSYLFNVLFPKSDKFDFTRSSSRYAALLLGPCGAGTLASRAGGRAFGQMAAPYGRRGAFG